MSLNDYECGMKIEAEDWPFYAVLQAAIRQADSDNLEKLRQGFPEVVEELVARRHASGGVLPGDDEPPPL